MSKEEVKELFECIGDVEDVYLPPPNKEGDTRNHRGFGFVEMATPDLAYIAIRALHGDTDYYGRELVVRLADPRKVSTRNE